MAAEYYARHFLWIGTHTPIKLIAPSVTGGIHFRTQNSRDQFAVKLDSLIERQFRYEDFGLTRTTFTFEE